MAIHIPFHQKASVTKSPASKTKQFCLRLLLWKPAGRIWHAAIISSINTGPSNRPQKNNLTACGFREVNQRDMKEKARDLH